MKDNFFDKLIKEKALDHEADVPADAWDNIQKNKKKRRYAFLWWLLPFLLIGFSLLGVYHFSEKKIITASKDNAATENNISDHTLNKIENDEAVNNSVSIKDSLPIAEDVIVTQKNTTATLQEYNIDSITTSNNGAEINADKNFNNISAQPTMVKKKIINKKHTKASANKTISNVSTVTRINTSKKTKPSIPAMDSDDQAASTPYPTKKKKAKLGAKQNITIIPVDPSADNDQINLLTDNTVIKIDQPITILPGQKDSDNIVAKNIMEDKKTVIPVTNEPAKKSAKKSKLSKYIFVDISASPFAALQQNEQLSSIERTTLTPDNKTVFKTDKISTRLDPSIAFTISLRKQLNKRLSFAAGLQYSKIKETIRLSGKETNTKYNYIKRLDPSGSMLVDDTVQVLTEGIRIIDAVNSFDFITIPLSLQYKLFERNKWSMMINGGIYLNIRSYYKNSIQGNLEKHYTSNATTANTNNKITTDIYAGLRVSRSLSKGFQYFAEPFLQYNFMRYNMKDMINNKNIHRAGINIGITYALKY